MVLKSATFAVEMTFFSVPDFFNKLQSKAGWWLTPPMILFLIYYFLVWLGQVEVPVFQREEQHLLFWTSLCATLITVTIYFFLTERMIREVSRKTSLGERMELLGDIYKGRLTFLSVWSMALVLSIYASDDSRIGLIVVGLILLYYFFRPTTALVIRDLQLKGDERKLIENLGQGFGIGS